MTLEEMNKILNTEKFPIIFNKTTPIIKMKLLKMRKVFSTYFNIPENIIYSNITYFRFFSLYINNFTVFDINQIKLDILNKMPIINICLKYLEPIEVIEEIKNNIEKDILILNSKFYTSNELTKIFNIVNSAIAHHIVLSKIKIKYSSSKHGFWVGSDINNNLSGKLKVKDEKESIYNNIPIISTSALAKEIKVSNSTILRRIDKKMKIFGIEVEIIDRVCRDVFIKKEDYNAIIRNKKYYLSIKESGIFDNNVSNVELSSISSYYKLLYNNDINLKNAFIKKEKASIIKNLIQNIESNFSLYFDNLYNNINKSKLNKYSLKQILFAFGNSGSKKTIIKKFNITSDVITKTMALKILDYMRVSSKRYNKISN